MASARFLLGLPLILAACASGEAPKAPAPPPMVGMANPASVYCESAKIGGVVSLRRSPEGEYGVCVLPDGTEIEEWALFRRDNPQ